MIEFPTDNASESNVALVTTYLLLSLSYVTVVLPEPSIVAIRKSALPASYANIFPVDFPPVLTPVRVSILNPPEVTFLIGVPITTFLTTIVFFDCDIYFSFPLWFSYRRRNLNVPLKDTFYNSITVTVYKTKFNVIDVSSSGFQSIGL